MAEQDEQQNESALVDAAHDIVNATATHQQGPRKFFTCTVGPCER